MENLMIVKQLPLIEEHLKDLSTEKCSPNNNKFKFINLNLYNNKHRICG